MSEKEQLLAIARTWPEKARAIEINDDSTYQAAGEMLRAIKGLRKRIADYMDPIIKKAHEAHKASTEAKRSMEAPLVQAEIILKNGCAKYQLEQERIRREEAARFAAAARAAEEERLLQEAMRAEAMGDKKAAEAILERPVVVPIVAPPPPPKPDGISFRETWDFEIFDMVELVKYVAAHPDNIALLLPNETALRGLARAQRNTMAIPGVRAVKKTTTVART